MDLNKLRRFSSEGYDAIAPEDFPEAARFCREHGINNSDMRFVVLERCFEISYNLWGDGDGGGAHGRASDSLLDLWRSDLPSILDEGSEEALALAQHLEEELRLLVLANPPP